MWLGFSNAIAAGMMLSASFSLMEEGVSLEADGFGLISLAYLYLPPSLSLSLWMGCHSFHRIRSASSFMSKAVGHNHLQRLHRVKEAQQLGGGAVFWRSSRLIVL